MNKTLKWRWEDQKVQLDIPLGCIKKTENVTFTLIVTHLNKEAIEEGFVFDYFVSAVFIIRPSKQLRCPGLTLRIPHTVRPEAVKGLGSDLYFVKAKTPGTGEPLEFDRLLTPGVFPSRKDYGIAILSSFSAVAIVCSRPTETVFLAFVFFYWRPVPLNHCKEGTVDFVITGKLPSCKKV